MQQDLVASNGDKSKLIADMSRLANELFVAKEKLALSTDVADALKQRNASIESSLNAASTELHTVRAERDAQAAQLKQQADELSAQSERLELAKQEFSRKQFQSTSYYQQLGL